MENYTNLLCFQLKFVIGDYKSFPMKKSQIFNLKKTQIDTEINFDINMPQ